MIAWLEKRIVDEFGPAKMSLEVDFRRAIESVEYHERVDSLDPEQVKSPKETRSLYWDTVLGGDRAK
jgi:hypothetical protein